MDDANFAFFQGLICPTCFARNRPAANYCDNCGRSLAQVCAACGSRNRLGANFCDHCGLRLEGQPAEQQTLPKPQAAQARPLVGKTGIVPGLSHPLSRHIPEEFATRLETARSQKAMLGERRIVTFLFCDIQGSTAAAGEMDPEEWAEIINEVFEIMIQPVYQYEGIVARLMGDAILAFFGAPIAHEDDPQRAILAGLEIVQKMQAYRLAVNRDRRVDLNLRVGINTGLVMVGQVGSDLQMEYTALGDAINIAARMEQTAQPGSVQVAEDTYRLVEPLFEFEDLGTVEVKGKPEPVHTYRPLRPKDQPGRLRGIQGLSAPLVGREAEYAALHSALQDLQRGVGKIVFLVGEAGLGKSRLIREAKEAAKQLAGEVAWYQAASLSYETVTPYGLFQHLFRSLWGISANEPAETVREKIASLLPATPFAGQPQVQAVFEALLGQQSDLQSLSLEGESLKRRLFEVVLDLWRYKTAGAPTVLVFDDLHWADPASVELLLHLVQLTDQAPLLVICATRFDLDSPGWQARQALQAHYPHRFSEISLKPLNASESDTLVDSLLTIADLPDSLRRRILEKTEGNPFFIEEVIRVLIDRGVVVPEVDPSGQEAVRWRAVLGVEEIDIPENLLTLLIARIDRLEEHARRTLQLASVIGRSFYYRILQAINPSRLPAPDELDRELLVLQQAELIREAARIPELEYMFRHSLTQEAAYETILIKQRREFHLRVGEAIEQIFASRLEEFYPILAHHFGEAGSPRALQYAILSADSAFRLYAIPEALAHYERAWKFARSQGEGVSSETWTHLYTRRGRAFELQSNYPEALQNYEEMLALARQRQDSTMELAALLAQATAVAIPTPVQDTSRARDLSEQALALARQAGDRPAEARILWNFLLLHNYSGRMREGIPFGEQSVALARLHDLPWQLAHSLQDLCLSYMGAGMLEKARQALDEAYPIWKELGNMPMLSENLANSVLHRILVGEFQEAIPLSEEALRISRQIGNEWGQINSQIFINQVYVASGETDRAIQLLQSVIPTAQRLSHPGWIICQVQMAMIYHNLGVLDRALEASREALDAARIFPPFRAVALACQSKLSLEAGDVDEAARYIEQSVQSGFRETLFNVDAFRDLTHCEVLFARKDPAAAEKMEALLRMLRQAGARSLLPEALLVQARGLEAQGKLKEACAALEEAQGIAAAMGSRTVLWRILAALANLEAARGGEEKALALRQQAWEHVRFISAHTSEEALRGSLLRLAEGALASPAG